MLKAFLNFIETLDGYVNTRSTSGQNTRIKSNIFKYFILFHPKNINIKHTFIFYIIYLN